MYTENATRILKKALLVSETWFKALEQEIIRQLIVLYTFFVRALQRLARHIRFTFYSVTLLIRAVSLYVWKYVFERHKFGWFTLVYFAAIMVLAVTLFYLPISAIRFDTVTFFTAAGAASLGALAIVFSIAAIQVQTASQQTSAGLYRLISTDIIHTLIYWAVALIAVALFFAAAAADRLPTTWQPFLEPTAVILVGLVLWLLHLLFRRVRSRINPFEVSKYLRKIITKDIDHFEKNIKRIARYIELRPDFDQTTPPNAVRAGAMQRLDIHRNRLSNWFNHLFDYHAKLVASKDAAAGLEILQTIHAGLARYLEMVKDASILYTAGLLATASNSQKFLEFRLEKMVSVGTQYMQQNDNNGIRYTIEILEELAVQSAEITYGPHRSRDNPIFEQLRFTLDQLKQEAIKQQSLEGAFRVVLAYERLAMVAIQRDIPYQLDAIYKSLKDIFVLGIAGDGHQVTWGQILETHSKILAELVNHERATADIDIKSIFENLGRLLKLSSTAMTRIAFNTYFDYSTKLGFLFSNLHSIIFQIAQRGAQSQDKEKWQRTLLSFVDELYMPLRNLVETVRLNDITLTRQISDLCEIIGCLMIELTQSKHWPGKEDKLIREAISYLYLPTFLVPKTGKITREQSLDEIVEAVAKIGICALENKQPDLAKRAVKSLHGLANIALEREASGYGFTEPRIMLRACYIGLLALKRGQRQIVDDLKTKVTGFDKKYADKWFKDVPAGMRITSPRPDQLFWEVVEMRDDRRDFNRMSQLGILNRAEGQVLPKITVADIDAFTLAIWGKQITDDRPRRSPVV